MSDPYTIPDGELCKVCGLTFYQRSFGGPNVCPSCDCGNFGAPVVQLQAKEIERLRAELEKMTESNAANWTNWWDVTQERDAALARERGLREALEAWHTFATGALHWDSTDWLVRITDAALAASVVTEPLSVQPSVAPLEGHYPDCEAITIGKGRACTCRQPTGSQSDCHGLDTPASVCFYEHDFYPLSNFSAFNLKWRGHTFPTSEHAYQWEKFRTTNNQSVTDAIRSAPSAHEAFKIAETWKGHRRSDWDTVKVDFMREILCAKVVQHEYVRRKLIATGDRELVEDSWRDSFWGWGQDRNGQNMLGKLWMQVRAQVRASVPASAQHSEGDI